MTIPPLAWIWDGEVLSPRYPKVADRHFVIGETYILVEHLERSQASHAHYFAAIREVFVNLPETMAGKFRDADALRKHALIMTGYRDERSIVCASKAEAERVAAFISARDDYAIISVSGAMVIEWTAKSQSMRAMGKDTFGESKQAVLEYLADLINVDAETLRANAGRSA